MATYGSTLRRGLPRSSGGSPWPPAGEAPGFVAAAASPAGATAPVGQQKAPASAAAGPVDGTASSLPAASAAPTRIRRGLPRERGGEPWPPASVVAAARAAAAPTTAAPDSTAPAGSVASTAAATDVAASPAAAPPASESAASAHRQPVPVRRGLPRVAGGEPWPPADFTGMALVPSAAPEQETPAAAPAESTATASAPVAAAADTEASVPAAAAFTAAAPATAQPARTTAEPKRYGRFTLAQWIGASVLGIAALVIVAGLLVLGVRWLLSLDGMRDFLATYPGEYHLPEGAPVGLPAWLGWQHFFNVFLMVLIIRSGLQVRREKRPPAYWSPRAHKDRKISLNLWFHQSLDILWLVNGLVFVILLFVTGQWMRIVPTSWEVFPNALSAALQYVSLDWPTENGWVNYNALQQLAYFATVFLAAPLAAITGVRMSGVWPKNAKTLSRIYPVEAARAVHFPVMLYFVLFIFVHVMLVLSTGALRNLNHMYAATGSPDPTAYADNWVGFWMFAGSLVVIAGAWVAARPLVLAPIARLFGTVSAR